MLWYFVTGFIGILMGTALGYTFGFFSGYEKGMKDSDNA
jgi:hypothetical protein